MVNILLQQTGEILDIWEICEQLWLMDVEM